MAWLDENWMEGTSFDLSTDRSLPQVGLDVRVPTLMASDYLGMTTNLIGPV